MPKDRRHASIMFTDIVGYTALMGSNEDSAFEILSKNREIHIKLVEQFNGTLVKEMGDGMLITFNLASDAVYCAIEIQKKCKEQDIPLKIGIHEGEMVYEGADVLGDAVNIASRLESDTKEGCIYISGSVYRDIKNRSDIHTKYIKEKTFKNMDEPIKVYQVLCEDESNLHSSKTINAKRRSKKPYYPLAGLAVVALAVIIVWKVFPSKPVTELEKSIAVLPFKNLSNNPEDLYLADGMMDAILNHLQKIEDLSVRSRTSTEQYRDPDRNISEIGKALKANYILEGSFQKIGDKANLTVQLIIAETDVHIWAEDYKRDWSEVFTVQKEVAEGIAKELYATISAEAKMGIDAIPTTNTMAYELFLKGDESYWAAWSAEDKKSKTEESIMYLKKAIELDPDFSLAYTGLGRSLWFLGDFSMKAEEQNIFEEAKRNLKKAIDLDKYNGWAYAELAVVSDNWDKDTTNARMNLEMARLLKPNDENVYIHYFFHEMRLGNCNKLQWIRERQIDINPGWDHPLNTYNIAILYCQQDYTAIEEIFDNYWEEIKSGTININGWRGNILFLTFLQLKNIEKGERVIQNMKSNPLFSTEFMETILKARNGDTESVLNQIHKLENSQNYYANICLAMLYSSIGNQEKMYNQLNSALLEMDRSLIWLNFLGLFKQYEKEERFKNIVNKVWTPRPDSLSLRREPNNS